MLVMMATHAPLIRAILYVLFVTHHLSNQLLISVLFGLLFGLLLLLFGLCHLVVGWLQALRASSMHWQELCA
jgi:hypothetical protein